ncbi:adenylyltransferase/cytidyltransferase family protein, partial [Patescibacteria group bacterium]|nr:adenylyltransferase/cytidyltransferase family protein [Patescibacteria group bacterium]
HPGHLFLLKQAKQQSNFLMVIIARDATVKKVKGHSPYFNELERVNNFKALRIANRVALGNRGDKLKIVSALKPDIICLGYDQGVFTANLKEQLKKRGLEPKIIRMKPLGPDKYKTSLLYKNNLVALKNIDPTIICEPRYATKNNFLKKPLYLNKIILARKNIAEKLKRVQRNLRKQGLGLKIWDCYRPLSVQKQMWKFKLDERYIGDPKKKPFHTRAAAVDCTLVDRNGRELVMPTPFDEFSPRAHRDHPSHSPAAKKNMLILEKAMRQAGLKPFPTEWWHFTDPNWKKYPCLDIAI